MTKQDLMNYVTETPENVNKNILSQKIDQYVEETGGSNAVQYIPQELTEDQQMQARENLGLYGDKFITLLNYEQVEFNGGTPVEDTLPTPEEGVEYYVNINGKVGQGICVDASFSTVYSGPELQFNFSDESISLKYIYGMWEYYLETESGWEAYTGTATIFLAKKESILIPEKYIPDTIARKSDMFTETYYLSDSVTKNHGFVELTTDVEVEDTYTAPKPYIQRDTSGMYQREYYVPIIRSGAIVRVWVGDQNNEDCYDVELKSGPYGSMMAIVPGVVSLRFDGGRVYATGLKEPSGSWLGCWFAFGYKVYNLVEGEHLPKIDFDDLTGDTVTVSDFNRLLSVLRDAGYAL